MQQEAKMRALVRGGWPRCRGRVGRRAEEQAYIRNISRRTCQSLLCLGTMMVDLNFLIGCGCVPQEVP